MTHGGIDADDHIEGAHKSRGVSEVLQFLGEVVERQPSRRLPCLGCCLPFLQAVEGSSRHLCQRGHIVQPAGAPGICGSARVAPPNRALL